MRIRQIKLRSFRRFTELRLEGLSPDIRLVILAGPNGRGKSSLFDALHVWQAQQHLGRSYWRPEYHYKNDGTSSPQQELQVEMHEDLRQMSEEERRKALYVRSAYRNEPEINISAISRALPVSDEQRIMRMAENDVAVARNYERLAAQGLADLFEGPRAKMTFEEYRKESIGDLREALTRLFPDLALSSLGNPITEGTFHFDKGTTTRFRYENLSGGEKAAFDLLLDMCVKRRELNNTVYCIDEPEAHMNTRLQGALLEELYNLLPEKSQLWLATHSIGMLRKARDLEQQHPGSVAFFDFESLDFDQPQVMTPIVPNRSFWQRVLGVALDDLASLVVPKRLVICEGKMDQSFDAACYNQIFENEVPDTRFLSVGSATEVVTDRLALRQAIVSLAQGITVLQIIDRDDRGPEEITDLASKGIKTLSRRSIESYLFDDEVLRALCEREGQIGKVEDLLAAKAKAIESSRRRGNPADDLKSASGDIYNAAKRILGLVACGNDSKAFMRQTLASLLGPSVSAYAELKRDIFG